MKKSILIEQVTTSPTTWLITMYQKKNWWSVKEPIAQWQESSKKTIMKKATILLEQFGKLEMEIR